MNIINIFRNVSGFIADFIFPPRCALCGKVYRKTSFTEKVYICDHCKSKIRFTENFSSLCKKCSRPISDDDILCLGCQIFRHNFDIGFSCALYEKEMRLSLLSYKFSEQHYKYRTYAAIMLDKIQNTSPFPEFDVIATVPLSKKRRKKRGFDHVAPIARYLSKATGIHYEKNGIIKIKDTPPQSKLTLEERRLSVKGAFKVNDKSDFRGKSVLLIDDIYTTGSTVDEIAKILKKKGAEYITVLTLCITKNIER